MAVLDASKTLKNLLKKGFVRAVNKGDDHKWIELVHEGKVILHTKISHGSNELNDYLIKQMYTQCKLEKKAFIQLASCTLSGPKYIEILKQSGMID